MNINNTLKNKENDWAFRELFPFQICQIAFIAVFRNHTYKGGGDHAKIVNFVNPCVCVCVCVWVGGCVRACVRAREHERERERVREIERRGRGLCLFACMWIGIKLDILHVAILPFFLVVVSTLGCCTDIPTCARI